MSSQERYCKSIYKKSPGDQFPGANTQETVDHRLSVYYKQR